MILTITCTAAEATDLGYLLHKNPGALYEKTLSFGVARVFYPEATAERCTMALQVEVDPIGLVRGKGPSAPTLAQYVSDRPYAPSSFLSVALAECFGTALGGRSKERQERAGEKMLLAATLHALDCDGGEELIRSCLSRWATPLPRRTRRRCWMTGSPSGARATSQGPSFAAQVGEAVFPGALLGFPLRCAQEQGQS